MILNKLLACCLAFTLANAARTGPHSEGKKIVPLLEESSDVIQRVPGFEGELKSVHRVRYIWRTLICHLDHQSITMRRRTP